MSSVLRSRSTRFVSAVGVALAVIAISVIPGEAVPTDANSALGVPSGTTLSYTLPEPFTVTMTQSGVPADFTSGPQSMNSASWWGGDTAASIANMSTAYTPTSVTSANGLTAGWWNQYLPGVVANWPSAGTPSYNVPAMTTITFTFSKPVTDAVLHLNNLGGRRGDTGFDYTLFSDWTITSGQTLEMLSGSATTNIMLDGNTIRNKNTPQSLESKVAAGSAPFPANANGTGSGSFVVHGTYSAVTFSVGLTLAVVNYVSGTPSDCGNNCVPEYVAVQWSAYKERPPVPPVDPVVPSFTG